MGRDAVSERRRCGLSRPGGKANHPGGESGRRRPQSRQRPHRQRHAPELLHDTREPYVKHDELVALDFRDKENKPVGLVVQWNCHPETLGDKNTQISADFVGAVVKTLHDKHRCPVVYLTGTVGGLMTSLHVEVKDAAGKALEDGTFAKTERYGELLAEVAEHALKTARPVKLTPLRARRRMLFLPLDNKLFLLARQLGVLKREAFVWTGDPYKAEAAKDVKAGKPLCLRTEIAWLRLGDLDIAAIPGEIYPELVLGKVQNPADPASGLPRRAHRAGHLQATARTAPNADRTGWR